MKHSIPVLIGILLVLLLTSVPAFAETAADVPSMVPQPCDLADLRIVQAFIPAAGGPGMNMTINLVIRNVGLSASHEIPVRVTLPNGKSVNLTDAIPAIDAGETKRVLFAFTIPKDASGNNHLSIMLDPEKTEEECSWSDNHVTGPFRIIAP